MQSFSLITLLLGVIGVTVLSRSSSSSSCDAFAPRLGPTSPPKLSPAAAAVSSASASSLAAAASINDDVRAGEVATTLATLGLLFAVATTATPPACATAAPPSSISSISSSLVLAGGEIKESDIADFSLPSYADASRAATNSNLKGETSLLDATFAKQFADLDVGSSKAKTTTDISAEDAKAAKDAAKAAQKAARAAQQAAAEQALSK